jgi:hypothetical protein
LGEYITDQESIVKKPVSKFVDKNHGGDISRTFGGYITDFWGIYHGLLGDISRTFGGYITDQGKKKNKKINVL